MIRILMSIRPSELVVALLVAVGVVVFGSVEEARADFSSTCAELDYYESKWICDWEYPRHCKKKSIGICTYKVWRQIKVEKHPIGGCYVADTRCSWTSCFEVFCGKRW